MKKKKLVKQKTEGLKSSGLVLNRIVPFNKKSGLMSWIEHSKYSVFIKN